MRISVFSLGYVASVTARCLAQSGHDVIGVDVNELKVSSINDGKGPIIEEQLNTIIGAAVKLENSGRQRRRRRPSRIRMSRWFVSGLP